MSFVINGGRLAAAFSSMGVPNVKVGTVIAGRYRLVAPLSRGGMGSVWRGEHLSLGSPIAVKLIDASLVEHAEARARFEREARAAAALRSPHVVQILDHGVDKNLPFMVMELLEGESLASRLHRLRKLPAAQTVRVFQDVARAIRKAHEAGIIHRDLKPDNIFLVRNDDLEIAKVLDFGIAKSQEPFGQWTGGTRTGALIGTPQYMSPEQAQGNTIDATTDLWALGVIAFECVCGRLPFPSEKPGELILQICAHPMPVPSQVAYVPPRFDAWFARACAREPRGRFASAKELAETLSDVLGAKPSADVSGPVPAVTTGPVVMPGPQGVAAAGGFGPSGTVLPAHAALPAPPAGAEADAAASGPAGVFGEVSTGAPTMVRQAPSPVAPPGSERSVDPLDVLPDLSSLSGAEPTTVLALRSDETINGAVMDSDPATFLALSGGARTRKVKVALVLAGAVLVGLALLVALGGEPAVEVPSGPEGASLPPAATPSAVVTPVQPVPSTTSTADDPGASSATAPGTEAPAASASASASGKAGPSWVPGPRGTVKPAPSSTATVNPLIGF